MSRRVLPVCGNLCFFCPSLRARSRQPVKRYKKLLADIFPRNQDAEPNDRKIGKLCEYASKNPLRIPKITNYLEHKCYKELRNQNFGSVKVVLCVYRKLLSACKEQMPLFANSLLGIIRSLLEQTRQDEMRILGCSSLVDFISNQMDSSYMFNLEGLIPKLCQVAQEVGDDERALFLRSAGMRALAYMVSFMGEQSHISMDFDAIISATLENYVDCMLNLETAKEDRRSFQTENQGVCKERDNGSFFPHIIKKVPSIPNLSTISESDSTVDTSKSPSYWSRVCLCNMARLSKEATTVRRILEPLFHTFDAENYWCPEKGVACSVLQYLQSLLEESDVSTPGESSHLLLSILVKHLDHKTISKQPLLQINIVDVTAQLAGNTKQHASVAITAAITDLIKHLRKCLQSSAELGDTGEGVNKWNTELQSSLENCISQFSNKVGDVGPILDMIAMVLENISTNTIVARTTISAVHRTVQIISCIPNISYHKKAFPDALFHQLLLAMAHPDHETRVGAHSVFSIVLMPSLLSPWSDQNKKPSEAVPTKVRSGSFSFQDEDNAKQEHIDGELREEGNQISDTSLRKFKASHSRGQSFSFQHALTDGKRITSLRLSSHQVSLILSSIWVQATSVENTPANFEAMAHTYNIALLYTRTKTSSHLALVRCFQLAFSLRRVSLDQDGGLQPSRRRSLFTLASYMLIFSAKAGNLPGLIPIVKASLTDNVDPYLELVEDVRLQAVGVGSDTKNVVYGSEEDGSAALKSLSTIESEDRHLKEIVISHFMAKYGTLSEDELLSIRKQILQAFSPDDAYPLGGPLFMETPRPCSPLARMESLAFDEVMPSNILTDEEALPESSGSLSGRKTSLSINTLDILSVNELLESVLETARQVASFPVSSAPIPYDEMKSQCEALVSCKQKKMSVLRSFKHQQEAKAITISDENEKKDIPLLNMKSEISEDNLKLVTKEQVLKQDQFISCSHEQRSFRLPPSSPYDKFLKAAGC